VADLAELYLVLKAKADPLIKSINDLKRELPKQMAEAGKAGGDALEAEAKNAGDDAGKALGSGLKKGAKKGMDDARKEVADARGKLIGEVSSVATSTGRSLSLAITAPVALLARTAIKDAMGAETALSQLRGAAGATEEQMKRASANTRVLVQDLRDFGLTETQVTQASTELAKAGLTLDQALKSTRASLVLASAGQLETAEAAQVTANALNAFSLKAEQAGRVVDIIAGTASEASGGVKELTEAFKMGSAVAAQAGVDIRDFSAALGLMANAGMMGSDAGTSLKSSLLALIGPSKEATKYMETLGIQVFTTEGRMKSLPEIVRQFEKGLTGLTQQQKLRALTEIFGTDGIRAFNILLKNGSAGLVEFAQKVDKSGKALGLANSMTGETQKAFNRAKVEVSLLSSQIGQELLPTLSNLLTDGVRAVRSFRDSWDGLSPELQKLALGTLAFGATLGPLAIGLGSVAGGVKSMIELSAAFVAAQAAKQTALSGTTVATNATAAALIRTRLAFLGLYALAAVPIILTVKAVFDYSNAASAALRSTADRAAMPFNRGDLLSGKIAAFRQKYGRAPNKVENSALIKSLSQTALGRRLIEQPISEKDAKEARVAERMALLKQSEEDARLDKEARKRLGILNTDGTIPKATGSGGGGGTKRDPISDLISAGQSSLDRQESEKRIKAFINAGNWTAAAFEQAGGKFTSQWGRITAAKRKIFEKLGEGLKSEFVAEQKQKAAAAKQMEDDLLREIREVNNPASMVDKLAREKFGKDFTKLTDPKNRSLIGQLAGEYEKKESSEKDAERSARLAREEEERMNRRNRWILGRNDAVKSMVASLDAQLRKERELSTFEQMVAEAKEKGIRLNFFEIAVLKERATQVDALKKTEKEQAENEKAAQIRREQIRDANEQYADALEEIATQAAELGRSGVLTEFRLKRLAITFGYGATESERLATGMERAKRVMREQLLLQDVKVWRDAFERVADAIVEPIRDALGELVTVDMPGFFRSLNTLVGRALTEFTNQILQAQIRLQLNRAIDWGVGQLFGGQLAGLTASGSGGTFMPPGVSLSPDGSQSMLTGFANGGGVGANSPIVVGERGPEIFVPSRSGNIVPNHRAGVGGQIVNITVNVQGSATRETAQQIAMEVARAVESARRSLA
jgi:TP901 family phage tail tape measure protein